MKTDIILAGVGGQGILSIAAIIGLAALQKELHVKQAETHGMSQRGGAVVSHLRISDKPIWSDLIPLASADLILSLEPMEALRYLPYLAPGGSLVSNKQKVENIPNYPNLENEFEKLSKQINVIRIDADEIATELGIKKASNMVMLGAASMVLNMSAELFEKGIATNFKTKGDAIISINIAAFYEGRKFANQLKG